jgi:nitroimidazol reductase NimA-like FMN-containing flavoprotein (pyridoxamine 5'-phosphate oxidase superfamily)
MTKNSTADKEIKELTPAECRALLEEHHIGRVAFLDTVGVTPVILPVNYLVHGHDVVFRTDPGSKLRAALHNAPVAFEIDGVDHQLEVGWSVLVSGRIAVVTDRAELDYLRGSPLNTWAPGVKGHFLRISSQRLTGRQITISDLPSNWWG